jgi:hypothetical protein
MGLEEVMEVMEEVMELHSEAPGTERSVYFAILLAKAMLEN